MKLQSFFLFIFFFLIFFFSGFCAYYLYKYPEPSDTAHLNNIYPKDLILKTGALLKPQEKRMQYFLNFPIQKKQNTIRIGAFGDSFTLGSEVDEESSYPRYLQKLFEEKFPDKKVEILNFGIAGVGFQEQFFLWEKYSKAYGLDYILLGPRGFYPERDLTFGKNWGFESLKYPRARFILSEEEDNTPLRFGVFSSFFAFMDKTNSRRPRPSGKKTAKIKPDRHNLKRIQIKGDTLKKKYTNYYTLFPSWTALRYDEKPFQIWERLFPVLRNKIQNPFYYKKMPFGKESAKINILLLKKIKQLYDKKILLFTDVVFEAYKPVEKLYNINLLKIKDNRFYTVLGHRSSLGNELIAKAYFQGLTGKKDFYLDTFQCDMDPVLEFSAVFRSAGGEPKNFESENIDKNRKTQGLIKAFQETSRRNPKSKKWNLHEAQSFPAESRPVSKPKEWNLYEAQSIQAVFKNTPLFKLRYNSAYRRDDKILLNNIKGWGGKKIKSFIGFSNESDFLEGPFFPLSVQLKDNMKIYAQLKNENKIELGSIKPLDAYKKFFVFYKKYIKNILYSDSDTAPKRYESLFPLNKIPLSLKKEMEKSNHPAKLFVEDYQFGLLEPFHSYHGRNLKFIFNDNGPSFLMTGPAHHIKSEDLPSEFSLFIQYNMNKEKSFKSPIPHWICKKERQPVHLKLPDFEPLNLY